MADGTEHAVSTLAPRLPSPSRNARQIFVAYSYKLYSKANSRKAQRRWFAGWSFADLAGRLLVARPRRAAENTNNLGRRPRKPRYSTFGYAGAERGHGVMDRHLGESFTHHAFDWPHDFGRFGRDRLRFRGRARLPPVWLPGGDRPGAKERPRLPDSNSSASGCRSGFSTQPATRTRLLDRSTTRKPNGRWNATLMTRTVC